MVGQTPDQCTSDPQQQWVPYSTSDYTPVSLDHIGSACFENPHEHYSEFYSLKQSPLNDPKVCAFLAIANKTYTSEHHEKRRLDIFIGYIKKIEKHNAEEAANGRHGFTTGINHFADMTTEEFVKFNGFIQSKQSGKNVLQFVEPGNIEYPKNVDWRKKGFVTHIKDQGSCGSCWAFSATGSLEGQWFNKTGQLVSLSEQNLVDCSTNYNNSGCEGGYMNNAFQYIKENGGIDTEQSYPYEAEDGDCRFKKGSIGATLSSYYGIPTGNEDLLIKAVATVGPISVGIDASSWSFMFYLSGVYDNPACSSTQLDHGVLAAGYGVTSDGVDYWLVKNSWGDNWGEKGYIRMSRNKDNQCGIATQASYPLV